ncbi:scavenger receptor cysteine-rich domain superfamily protein-like [Halichondria panicea]|uniref:scavenger receptor cysteine-rich domain superfamily protein-like n=1 Tax=Halichondria panicea TaxID=6063 RepID=UPI00312B92C8
MAVLVQAIIITALIGQLVEAQTECTNGEIRLDAEGGNRFVEFCSSGEWQNLCTNDGLWEEEEVTVACRQLGYAGQMPVTWGGACSTSPTDKFFSISMKCNGTENRVQDCAGVVTERATCVCSTDFVLGSTLHGIVQCQPADCDNGEVRLVSGDTCNEGRVEVCMNGRWGTVCNNTPELAGAVCSQLGFSPERATVVRYSPGFVPISNCVLLSGGDLNCSQLTDGSCDHSMDLGVVCRTYSDVKEISKQCTSMNLVAATNSTCPPTIDTMNTDSNVSRSITIAMGVIIAILIAVIVVMAITWTYAARSSTRKLSQNGMSTEKAATNGDVNVTAEGSKQYSNPTYMGPGEASNQDYDVDDDYVSVH